MNIRNNKEIAITKTTSFGISKQMHDILIGTLLGDGHLSSSEKGDTWSYRCLHAKKARAYLFHKYSIFQQCCLTAPRFQEFKGSAGQKLQRYYFNTRRLGIFKFYGDLFYHRVTSNTYDLIEKKLRKVRG